MNEKSIVVSVTPDNKITTSYQNFSLGELSELMAQPARSFEVFPRPGEVGGGWKLTLFEGKEEMGGGVFPAGDDGYSEAYQEGFDWQYQNV